MNFDNTMNKLTELVITILLTVQFPLIERRLPLIEITLYFLPLKVYSYWNCIYALHLDSQK